MRRGLLRLAIAVVALGIAAVTAALPAWGATGAWDRTWGEDVVAGNAETGPEICTIAAACQTGQDGTGAGAFSRPKDVAVAPNGDVYVVDEAVPHIEVFDAAGTFIREFGQFSQPNSVAIDGDGNVYVTEQKPRIQKFDAEGHFLRMWGKDVVAGNPDTGPEICTVESQCQGGTQTEDDGSHLAYEGGAFGYDNQVAASPDGTVYVMEFGRSRISEFDSSGHFLRLWGKDVVAGNADTGPEICTGSAQCKVGDAGTAGGEFGTVWYGATDTQGDLYVADSSGTSRVDEFTPSGTFLRAFGKNVDGAKPGTGFEVCTTAADCLGGDRAGTAGAFDSVIDVAVDAAGNVYTAEDQNHRIQKFTAAGAFVSTWGKGVNGGSGLETCTTVDGCSPGDLGGKGGEIDNTFPGIGADPVNGSRLYATGYEGHRVQAFGARAPTLTGTSPTSPSKETQPKLLGSAQDGATVKIYASSSCTGPVRGSGTAAELASAGIAVSVDSESTTTFYATATIGGETSDCSPTGLTYVASAVIDTAITSGPSGATSDAAPSFGFTADPPAGASFVCSVDNMSPSACSSPFKTEHLSDGSHEVEVAAIAPGGAQDRTPATRGFFVDTVVPATSPEILGGQRVGNTSTYHGTVLLDASAADPAPSGGGVVTRCAYNGAAAPPPASFDALSGGCTPMFVSEPGDYVFYAASRDAAGNVEPAVRSVRFTLLPGVEVSITLGPEGATWQKQPLFGFTSATAGATYRCSIGGSTYVTCQSPWLSPAQNPGDHAFYVKAVAPDGTESNVEARYYTIQAPTGAVNEPHGHCAVNPFVVNPDNPNGGAIIGCGFGKCPKRIACSAAIAPCPVGAICKLRFTSHFEDADPAITFGPLFACQQDPGHCLGREYDNGWWVTQRFDGVLDYAAGSPFCDTSVLGDPKACDVTSTAEIVGQNRAISPTCSAELDSVLGPSDPVRPGETQARDFGPDSSRHLDCDWTESIAPASALEIAGVIGPYSGLYAPAPGKLTLTGLGLGSGKATASAARKRPAKPGIKPIHITVKHPGAVRLRFQLNKAAKRLLARRHKLKLRVKVTLKPPHQAAITRTQTLTFTHPAKSPNAQQRRRAARRLCLRKHPHQARLCNRL